MVMTWVLIITLTTFPDPIALSSRDRAHCIDQMELVRALKGFESATCIPQFDLSKGGDL